jgi:hypothetical protein
MKLTQTPRPPTPPFTAMVSLMMAPFYRRMGTDIDGDYFYSGFSKWGSVIAVIISIIVCSLAYYFSNLFDKLNQKKYEESVALKKVADAKLRSAA